MQTLKIDNLNEENFAKLVEQWKRRLMLEDEKKEKEQTLSDIKEHKTFIDTQYEDKHEWLKEVMENFEECLFRIEQSKYNFETIIYIL